MFTFLMQDYLCIIRVILTISRKEIIKTWFKAAIKKLNFRFFILNSLGH